ncbi:MAG: hypothetical protein ACK5PW_17435 [Burkholderiales bacterium]
MANRRTDAYGGPLANRVRYHLEALDAVRAVWPERLPLTMRLGSDDLNPAGTQFDDALAAVAMMKAHGLDLADLSIGFNTDDMNPKPFADLAFMVERAARVRREVGIPVATSWNLGLPAAELPRPSRLHRLAAGGVDHALSGSACGPPAAPRARTRPGSECPSAPRPRLSSRAVQVPLGATCHAARLHSLDLRPAAPSARIALALSSSARAGAHPP